MTSLPKLAVVAVGGNSLIIDKDHISIPFQEEAAIAASRPIAGLIEDGWNLVVTHGNGPQVGFILRRSEIGQHEVPPIPMNYAISNTQGSIGYMFQKALGNECRRRGLDRQVVTVVTQTLVDHGDPAFENPQKPIGPHMEESQARRRASEQGWEVKEDAGRGWRRVVASPHPRQILELEVIRNLVETGTVVIACGGGGLPVVEDEDGSLQGVPAVIDKDHASSLLARQLGADLFLISTGVEKVALGFNTPQQRWLDRLTVAEARQWDREGHFADGSMGPKIRALADYVEATDGRGLITDPTHFSAALAGDAGTVLIAKHGGQ